MGNKNKSVSSSEKSQKPKDGKGKKDKKDHSEKKEVIVFINEEEADLLLRYNALADEIINVDDFSQEEVDQIR